MGAPKSNQFWWPERVDLAPLRQHSVESDPFGGEFDYAEAFAALDLAEATALAGETGTRVAPKPDTL